MDGESYQLAQPEFIQTPDLLAWSRASPSVPAPILMIWVMLPTCTVPREAGGSGSNSSMLGAAGDTEDIMAEQLLGHTQAQP